MLSQKAIVTLTDGPRFAKPRAADWQSVAWVLWGLASVAVALRTFAGGWRARRLLRQLGMLGDAQLQACLDESAAHFGFRRSPLLAVADVGVPLIWCWGRRPLILVPADATATTCEIDWVGIFRHELAHWKRRDHLTQAIARLVTILVPFHPFAWLVARRLNVLSERACDVWAVADGRSPLDYAESLLRLCPQRPPRLALAAVSGRKPLVARVRRLVNHRAAPPGIGTRWFAGRAACTIFACAALGLAQPRATSSPDSQAASTPANDDVAAPRPAPTGELNGNPASVVENGKLNSLAYRLPPDGTWVRYKITVQKYEEWDTRYDEKKGWVLEKTPDPTAEELAQESDSLLVRSVGRQELGGEPCRWIEIVQNADEERKTPPEFRVIVLKLLIPENAFEPGRDPFEHVRKMYMSDRRDGEHFVSEVKHADRRRYEVERFRGYFPVWPPGTKRGKDVEWKTPVGLFKGHETAFVYGYEGRLSAGKSGWNFVKGR